jgi:iron(III) transport system substrate-binding protein
LTDHRDPPIEFVYATEGLPLITGPAAIMKSSPNPNAARLFHNWSFTVEAQQLNVDVRGLTVGARPGQRAARSQTLE